MSLNARARDASSSASADDLKNGTSQRSLLLDATLMWLSSPAPSYRCNDNHLLCLITPWRSPAAREARCQVQRLVRRRTKPLRARGIVIKAPLGPGIVMAPARTLCLSSHPSMLLSPGAVVQVFSSRIHFPSSASHESLSIGISRYVSRSSWRSMPSRRAPSAAPTSSSAAVNAR
jgi:hypothetical protein